MSPTTYLFYINLNGEIQMSIPGIEGIIAGRRLPSLAGSLALAEYDAENTSRHNVVANGGVVSGNIPEWYSDYFSGSVLNTTKWPTVTTAGNGGVISVNDHLQIALSEVGTGWNETGVEMDVDIPGDFAIETEITVDQWGTARNVSSSQNFITVVVGGTPYRLRYFRGNTSSLETIEARVEGGSSFYSTNVDSNNTVIFGITRIDGLLLFSYNRKVVHILSETGKLTKIQLEAGKDRYLNQGPQHIVRFNYLSIDAKNLSTTRLIPEYCSDTLVGPTHDSTKWYSDLVYANGTFTYENGKVRFDVTGGRHVEHTHVADFNGDFFWSWEYDLISMTTDTQQWITMNATLDGGTFMEVARTHQASLGGKVYRVYDPNLATYINTVTTNDSDVMSIFRINGVVYVYAGNTLLHSFVYSGKVVDISLHGRADSGTMSVYLSNFIIDNGNLPSSRVWANWFSDTFDSLNNMKWAHSTIGGVGGLTSQIVAGRYESGYGLVGTTGNKDTILTSKVMGFNKSFVFKATLNTNTMDVDGGTGTWSQSVWFGFGGPTSLTGIRFYCDNSGTLSISIRNNGTEIWSAATFSGNTDYVLEMERKFDTIYFKIDGDIKVSATNTFTLSSPQLYVRQSGLDCPIYTVFWDDVEFIGSSRARMFLQSIDDKVIQFDGTGHLTILQSPDFNITDYYTISCLASLDDLTNLFTIFGLWQDANNRFRLDYSPVLNRFECSYMSGGSWVFDHYVDYPEGIEINRLYLFTLVRNGNSWQLMINGLKVGSPLIYSGDISLSSDLYIGDYNAGALPHKGNIVWLSVNNGTLYDGEFIPTIDPIIVNEYTVCLINSELEEVSGVGYEIIVNDDFSTNKLHNLRWMPGVGTWSVENNALQNSPANNEVAYCDWKVPELTENFVLSGEMSVINLPSGTPSATTQIGIYIHFSSGNRISFGFWNSVNVFTNPENQGYYISRTGLPNDYVSDLNQTDVPFTVTKVGNVYTSNFGGVDYPFTEASDIDFIRLYHIRYDTQPVCTGTWKNMMVLDTEASPLWVYVNQTPSEVWLDSIGEPQDLSATGSQRPLYYPNVVDTHGGLYFDNTNMLSLTTRLMSNPRFFAVSIIRPTSLPASQAWIWSQASSQGDFGIQVLSDGSLRIYDGSSGVTLPLASQLTVNQNNYIFFEYDNGNFRLWLNGELISTSSITFVFDGSSFSVGRSVSGSDGFDGYHFYHKFFEGYINVVNDAYVRALYKRLLNTYQ